MHTCVKTGEGNNTLCCKKGCNKIVSWLSFSLLKGLIHNLFIVMDLYTSRFALENFEKYLNRGLKPKRLLKNQN